MFVARVEYRDSACDSKAAVGAIFELIDTQDPDIILGPVCSGRKLAHVILVDALENYNLEFVTLVGKKYT